MYVIQSKNGIMMNVSVSVKNYMIGVFVKSAICGFLACVIVSVIRHVKLMTIQILKVAQAKKVSLVDKYWNVKMKC